MGCSRVSSHSLLEKEQRGPLGSRGVQSVPLPVDPGEGHSDPRVLQPPPTPVPPPSDSPHPMSNRIAVPPPHPLYPGPTSPYPLYPGPTSTPFPPLHLIGLLGTVVQAAHCTGHLLGGHHLHPRFVYLLRFSASRGRGTLGASDGPASLDPFQRDPTLPYLEGSLREPVRGQPTDCTWETPSDSCRLAPRARPPLSWEEGRQGSPVSPQGLKSHTSRPSWRSGSGTVSLRGLFKH